MLTYCKDSNIVTLSTSEGASYSNVNNDITVELFMTDKHYNMVCDWWKSHNHPIIPTEYLSSNGLIVFEGKKPICAAWLYRTDSVFCYLEHFVTNPNSKIKQILRCTQRGFEAMDIMARHMGFKRIFSHLSNSNFANFFKRSGYRINNNGMIHVNKDI